MPDDLAGVAFLSGGWSSATAAANLAAIRALPAPWPLTFSFGRALVSPALHAWRGDPPPSGMPRRPCPLRSAGTPHLRPTPPDPCRPAGHPRGFPAGDGQKVGDQQLGGRRRVRLRDDVPRAGQRVAGTGSSTSAPGGSWRTAAVTRA